MDPRVVQEDHQVEEAAAHREVVRALDQDTPQEGLN